MFFRHSVVGCILCGAVMLIMGCGDDTTSRTAAPSPVWGSFTPDTVIAVVNGNELTAGPMIDILERWESMYLEYTGEMPTEQFMMQQKTHLIEQLIREELVRQKIAAAEIEVSDDEIQDRLEDIMMNFPDEETFMEYLAHNGYTLETFMMDVRDDLLAHQLMRQEMDIPPITTEEARAFYDRNLDEFIFNESADVSHIFFEVPFGAPDEEKDALRTEMTRIRENILAGNYSFAEAAMEESECPSGDEGGFIGTFFRGHESISPVMEEAVFTAGISNVTDIVETDFGIHLLYVTKTNPPRTAPFEEVEDTLKELLMERKIREATEEWMDNLRSNARVQYK